MGRDIDGDSRRNLTETSWKMCTIDFRKKVDSHEDTLGALSFGSISSQRAEDAWKVASTGDDILEDQQQETLICPKIVKTQPQSTNRRKASKLFE